jgi:hypothetical protein
MSTARPLASVTLPDGQTVRAVVLDRRQEVDGSYWYTLELVLISKVERFGQPRAEPQPVIWQAPYPVVQPIAGEDYSAVTVRIAPTAGQVWLVEERHSATGTVYVLHRPNCAQPTGRSDRVGLEDAAALLGHDDAVPCTVCRPDAGLRGLV